MCDPSAFSITMYLLNNPGYFGVRKFYLRVIPK
jgi:hypothetical protein